MFYFTEGSQTSTLANMSYRDIISSSGHIFHEHKLPVSGYLVAWQYYINTGNVCTNTSYAAIIRRDGNKYTMIARTLLTPEDSTDTGVRFQFIQTEVIRVQKNDVIAAFTEKGHNSSCHQLVSVHRTLGSETLTVNVGTSEFKVNETKQLPYIGHPRYDYGERLADPALKAYVSGMY